MSPRDLVLLHGQPGLGSDWDLVIAALPGSLRAVAIDRPGHGSSQLPGGGLEINARAVLDVFDERGIDRAVLVGHSYGGGVALQVAAAAPERIEALVLLASVGPDCLNIFDWLLAAPFAGAALSRFAWQWTPAFARAVLRLMARRNGRSRHPTWEVWGHARWDNGPLWRTFLAEQQALVREAPAYGALAESISVPALVVTDPRDQMVPYKTAVALSKTLPDARMHLVKGTGHHLPMRAPETVARQIVTFLESLAAERAGLSGPAPAGRAGQSGRTCSACGPLAP